MPLDTPTEVVPDLTVYGKPVPAVVTDDNESDLTPRPCPVRVTPAPRLFSPADIRYCKAKTALLTVRDRLEQRAALDRPLTAGRFLEVLLEIEHERWALDSAVTDQ